MKVSILDRYILKSYLTVLVSFFFILMFIFIIQTVWVFIDEFAGKGLDVIVLLKFLLYYSPKLIPLVLPLTILLASIMTFGNFAERYEFAAMKSAVALPNKICAAWFMTPREGPCGPHKIKKFIFF